MSENSNIDLQEVIDQLNAGGNMSPELVEIFSEEAEEHMRTIYDGLDKIRSDVGDTDALGDVRRAAHTLKGAAGAVGVEAVTRLAHRMEDLLDHLAENKLDASESQIMLMLATADQLEDITTGEVNVDSTAATLVEIYQNYQNEMQLLSGGDVNVEAEDAADSAEIEVAAIADADESTNAVADEATTAVPPAAASVSAEEVAQQLRAGSNIDPEMIDIFGEEAEDHMRTIYDGLDRLRVDSNDAAALGDIRRASHTLKGAAGAVGFDAVTRLSHRMEDLLDHLAENNLAVSEQQIELLLSTADQLQDLTTTDVDFDQATKSMVEIYTSYENEMVALGVSSTTESSADEVVAEEVVAEEETPVAVKAKPEDKTVAKPAAAVANKEATQYLRVPIERLDNLVALVGEMIVNRSAFHQRLADLESRIEDMGTALSRFRGVALDVETRYSVEALKSGTRDAGGMTRGSRSSMLAGNNERSGEFDSLEFDRYTEFHLLARTLSEATNDVAVITSEFRNLHGDFDSLLGRQQRLNRDAQDSLMQIRMVPVSNIVNRLDRTVRSVSNKLGKKVDLVIEGEGTELDKTVLEEITDPLLHLIRNGLDHGVETPESRRKAGKPERSVLKVEALNQGTQVTIRVSDDGNGLDLEKIRGKAVERGMITEDQTLSKEEMHSLIFLPGFSTAASLTDVSGRGVGMDVVRDAVQRLKGTISVDSVQGQGSTFTIHLPTSLAVSRALLIESCGNTYAIPMQAVQKILRLDPKAVSYVGDQPIVNLGDHTQKISDMGIHQQIRSDDKDIFKVTRPMLLIREGDDEIAITVDEVFGGQDIVVKTLGDHLVNVPGLIGATVSGDGTVIPILDPAELVGQKKTQASSRSFSENVERAVVDRRKTAMVIDDSISVRRVTTNLLRSAGWDVIVAKDGVDALEQLAAADTPPEVFLCDMEMPRMDGIELVGRLRNMIEFASTPIVMVTSRAGEKHRKLAADAGANDHVVKPFNDDQLVSLITDMVNTARETIGA